MRKKILAMLLSAALCLGMAAPALAAEANRPGCTVTPGGCVVHTWAKDEIARAESAGLVPAPLAGTDLTGPISRAQFTSVAVRLYESMLGHAAQFSYEVPFTDIGERDAALNDPDPYYTDICKAYSLNLINGVSSSAFAPNEFLTREQAAVILARVYSKLVGAVPAGTPTFADSGAISGWARDAVAFMAGKGIIKGMDSSRFAPKDQLSAEQSILLALRMKTSAGASGSQGSIVGTWEISLEMADQMNEAFASSGLGDYIKLDSFVIVVDYTFHADGTYSCAADEAALQASMEGVKKAVRAGLTAYAEDMAAQYGQGLTADDVFAAAGTTLDEMMEQMFTEDMVGQMVESLAGEGNYKTGDGRLYLSAGLNYIPDEKVYHNYTIEGDTLTLLDLVGGGDEVTDMFPMELKKVK